MDIGFAPKKGCRPEEDGHDAGADRTGLQTGHDGIARQQRPQKQDPARARKSAGRQRHNDDGAYDDDV